MSAGVQPAEQSNIKVPDSLLHFVPAGMTFTRCFLLTSMCTLLPINEIPSGRILDQMQQWSSGSSPELVEM